MKKILLIDAYSQIFRAFYAIRSLNNSRGEPVNAAYVFTKLLLKLEKLYPTGLGAMLFDCGKVDFRLKLAPDYKANRPPMPDALKSQMPLVKKIAAAFGWQLLSQSGYEADDLIGAIVCQNRQDSRIYVVSSDKDLSQLVDENVSMLVPVSGGKGDFEVRDSAAVQKKFGVPPELIVDYLALLGDSSDNIAGIPGIGPKSAVELLTQFGPAGCWLENPELLENCRFKNKLSGNEELLKRNIELVRLRCEMPDDWSRDPEKLLKKEPPDWAEIAAICRDNQFNSILKELPEIPEEKAETVEAEVDLFSFIQPELAAEADAGAKEPQQLELF